jgi:hypothetical protein
MYDTIEGNETEPAAMTTLMTISPSWNASTWVFDDPARGRWAAAGPGGTARRRGRMVVPALFRSFAAAPKRIYLQLG